MATIYIHWPFCVSKCSYCDFNSFAITEKINFELWLKKYKRILSKFNSFEKITSIYFGGGTPSLLPAFFVENILKFIRENFHVVEYAEITIEANPGTISIEKAGHFKKAGINRLSIGVQSIYEDGLKMLGRISHSAEQAVGCVKEMSSVFDNISVDFIYNRPFQRAMDWKKELLETLDVLGNSIKHISCYELIVEEGTKLSKEILSGNLKKPEETDKFFDITYDILSKNGFEMYEVSNYAKPGYEGRHNLSYWKYEDYYGVGPGSHSRITENLKKIAIEQEKNPKRWLNCPQTHQFQKEILTDTDILQEKIIMGLRAKCGVNAEDLCEIPNINKKLSNLLDNLYIIYEDGRVIMTYEGLKRLNLIIRYILGE